MNDPGHQRKWSRLLNAAEEEIGALIETLPDPVRREAKKIPVCYEPYPSKALIADGLEPDILGLFVGENFAEVHRTDTALPAQILLFLESIWDYSDHDDELYREEVCRTYLHELGHYLGLDEDDLANRDLD